MISLLLLLLFIAVTIPCARAQTPTLIGLDMFAHPFICCVHDDVYLSDGVTLVSTECDPRSDGCDTDTFRCILSETIVHHNTSASAVLFAITPFAQLMPSVQDGKVQITLSLTGPVALKGFLQIWRKRDPDDILSSVHDFTLFQTFIDPLVLPQTALFHRLTAGTYVAVYLDTGGTRAGSGTPEISQEFVIPLLFSDDVEFSISFIPNDGLWTDIFVYNRHLLGHQLFGPPLFQQVFLVDALAGNRKVVWEHRTDQGNLINAKVDYEPEFGTTVPSDIFRFKHFPIMPGSKYTRLSARVVYIGLHPSSYVDYWTDREDFGYGTVLAEKVVVLARTVIPLTSTTANHPSDVIGLNSIVAIDPTTDIFTQRVVTRQHCNGCDENPSPFGNCPNPGTISCLRYKDWMYAGTGMYSATNDFNQFEDFFTDDDTSSSDGFIETRGWRFFIQFQDRDNNDPQGAYACRAVGTPPAQNADQTVGDSLANRFTVADISTDVSDFNSFFDSEDDTAGLILGADQCFNTNCGAGGLSAGDGVNCNCKKWVGANLGPGSSNLCCPDKLSLYLYTGVSGTCATEFLMNTRYIGGQNQLSNTFQTALGPSTSTVPDTAGLAASLFNGLEFDFFTGRNCLGFDSPSNTNPTARVLCIKFCASMDKTNVAVALNSGPETGYPQYLQDTYSLSGVAFFGSGGISNAFNTLKVADNFYFLTPSLSETSAYPTTASMRPTPYSINTIREPASGSRTLQGKFGLDTQIATLTVRLRNGDDDNDRSIMTTIAPTYARFKMAPTIEFMYFSSFKRGSSFNTIQITFYVSCPNLELGQYGATETAYCAEFWTLTNQDREAIIVSIDSGGPATLSLGASSSDVIVGTYILTGSSFTPGQALGEVSTGAQITVTIKHTDGDTLTWISAPRPEPEKPLGVRLCAAPGLLSISRTLVDVPPLQYIYQPMISRVLVGPPACEYNSPEMFTATCRGEFYSFKFALELELASVATQGETLDNGRYTEYYEDWKIAGKTVKGFREEYQLYDASATVTIYDQFSSIIVNHLDTVPQIAEFPNPLIRPPTCVSSHNATCPLPIVLSNSSSPYSGIIQYHHCKSNTPLVLLKCDLKFTDPPFSRAQNLGSVSIYQTEEFVDIFIEEIRSQGIHEMNDELTINVTGDYTCKARYGKPIDSLFEDPCYERLVCHSTVLTPFIPVPSPLIRTPGCTDPNNCCYQIPFTVLGNTPYTDDEHVDLLTCANGTDACKYEMIVTPAGTDHTHLCLGRDYTFTFQSPAELVAQRESPDSGTFFAYPWRCPASVTIDIPSQGLAPLDITLIPGDCDAPGSVVEIGFIYNNAFCSGVLTSDNMQPACRAELVVTFTKSSLPAQTFTPYVLGSMGSPFLPNYNLQQTFIYPDFISNLTQPISLLPPLPDGDYVVYLWLRPVGSGQTFAQAVAADPRTGVSAPFNAFLEAAEGVTITETTAPQRPTCPGTVDSPAPIVLNYNIQDQNWNGPYTTILRTPTGQVIYNVTTLTIDYCDALVCGLSFDPVRGCSGCDVKMRTSGIDVRIEVGTGPLSVSEDYGGYKLTVRAAGSKCDAKPFLTYMTGLGTLRVQVQCFNVTCPGTPTGLGDAYPQGGTVIPLEFRDLAINPLSNSRPLYTCLWNTTAGVRHECQLLAIGTGTYEITITDYNGCTVTQACTVYARSDPVTLTLQSAYAGNCSDDLGNVTFTAHGGVSNYTLLKIGSDQRIIQTDGTYLLQDTTAIPGSESNYMLLDAFNCPSPIIPVTIPASPNFTLFIKVEDRPCGNTDARGKLFAQTVPSNTGAAFAWSRDGIPLSVETAVLPFVTVGVYTVVVKNVFGCIQTASVSLTASANDLNITASRAEVNDQTGIIQGAMVGGNGSPYTLEAFPNEGFVFVFAEPAPQFSTSYRISLVPYPWSGRLVATDRSGCSISISVVGSRKPDTIQPFTPSPTPPFDPDHIIKPPKKKRLLVTSPEKTALISGSVAIWSVVVFLLFIWKQTRGFTVMPSHAPVVFVQPPKPSAHRE